MPGNFSEVMPSSRPTTNMINLCKQKSDSLLLCRQCYLLTNYKPRTMNKESQVFTGFLKF